MKQAILYSALVILLTFKVFYGQTCKVDPNELQERWNDYKNDIGFLYQNDLDPYVFNQQTNTYKIGLAVHLILQTGENYEDFQAKIDDDFDFLYSKFINQVGFSFERIKLDLIVDEEGGFYSLNPDEQENLASMQNVTNAVNVYYTDSFGSSGLATFSPELSAWRNRWIPSECKRVGQYIFIKKTNNDNSVLAHEMGHFFDLFHTYEEELLGSSEDISEEYDPTKTPFERGDRIPDTPECKERVYDEHCDNGSGNDWLIAKNLMTTLTFCRSEFTDYQVKMMRYTLLNRRPEYIREWIKISNNIDEQNPQNPGGFFKVTQNNVEVTIPSGEQVGLIENNYAIIEELNERFNYDKHHNWNLDNSSYLLKKEIFIQPAEDDQDAWFKDMHSATLKVSLIPEYSTAEAIMNFHDPWYVD